MLGQSRAVGGQRQFVETLAQMASNAPYQIDNIPPDQRFATSQPDLANAPADEEVGEQRDLLQRQDLILGQEGHALSHAIAAPQVAPIRDRNPQIADPAAQRIGHGRASKIGLVHARLARPWQSPVQALPVAGA